MVYSAVLKSLRRLGSPLEILSGENAGRVLTAVVTPLNFKNRQYLDGGFTQLGFADNGHYQIICESADKSCACGDRVRCNGITLSVKRWDTVYFKNRPVYARGVAVACGEGDK